MSSSRKSAGSAGSLAAGLMLAPAVMMWRMPLLAMEARAFNPWRVETTRAVSEKAAAAVEGMVAAQVSLALSASRFWLDLAAGRQPSLFSAAAAQGAARAALKPSVRRVRSNYRRLKPRS